MLMMHLGDLHIGKIVNEFHMLEDQRVIMRQVTEMAARIRPDVILLAGDIYDRNLPPASAVELFDEFLTGLSRLSIPVLMISGNHDSPERLKFGSQLLTTEGIYISCTEASALEPVRLEDAYGPVNFWLLPYLKTAAMKELLAEITSRITGQAEQTEQAEQAEQTEREEWAEQAHQTEHAQRTEQAEQTEQGERTEQADSVHKERNVLVAHCFVMQGNRMPELSDSESPAYVGGLDGIDVSAFDAFDYVALGHLHKPQSIGRPQVRYCGSWMKYSFSEAGQEKSVTFVRLEADGKVQIFTEPLKPLHDMRRIRGNLKDLLSLDVTALADPEDYLHVTLTDDTVLLDPMQSLRSVYPNVMQIAFERRKQPGSAGRGMSLPGAAAKTGQELFAEFYESVMERPLQPGQQKLLEEVFHEAQKIDD